MSDKKRFSIMEYLNGIYQGDFNQSSLRAGLGVYLWDSGEFYYGEWTQDYIEGEGILYFPYGGFIRGTFKRNRINGLGILKFPNGDMYKGEWKDGKLDGQCHKYFVQNDSWLICEYKDGVFEKVKSRGKGRSGEFDLAENLQILEDLESKYKSQEWFDFGYRYKCVTFPDNGKFIGVIKNDLPNGLGIFHYTDGKIDEGFYKDGLLDGFGRLNFQNGDIYDGMMKQGLFDGFGIFFKKSLNKWVYGIYEENQCKKQLENGQNKPNDAMELMKSDQHKTSTYFQEKLTKCKFFEIPQFLDNNQDLISKSKKKETISSSNNEKRKKIFTKTPNPKLKKTVEKSKSIVKSREISTNTEAIELNTQSTQANIMKRSVDSSTQTQNEDFEKDEQSELLTKSKLNDSKEQKENISKNEETQKTITISNNSSCLFNDKNSKKRLTKFEIESLFQSVKNMITGGKGNAPKEEICNNDTISKKLDIQNLKESTDFLKQKLENIKKSKDNVNFQQSLQSSDFMLSRSETNFDHYSNIINNNLNQKASNMIESKLLDSCFSNGNEYNNITKSIDYIEKMLNSQTFATKEGKLSKFLALSNIDHLGEHMFYSDAENENELFQSNVMASYKNSKEDENTLNNSPIIHCGNLNEIDKNKEKIMIFDELDGKKSQNQELMAKYGSGIEKIEEKAEECNYSPNSKNNLLKFNKENFNKCEEKKGNKAKILEINQNRINEFEESKKYQEKSFNEALWEKENENLYYELSPLSNKNIDLL